MAGPRTVIIIYEEKLRVFLNTPNSGDRRDLWRYIERRVRLATAAAQRQVGVKTGALRSSIQGYHLGNLTGQYAGVRATRPYALLHHTGTRPHKMEIIRRSGRSSVMVAKTIMHPGTKPNPYLFDQLGILAGIKGPK